MIMDCFQHITWLIIRFLEKRDKIYDAIKTVDDSIKGIKNFFEARITLTDDKMKDIVKVFRKFRNFLLKGTTRKINSQEGGF